MLPLIVFVSMSLADLEYSLISYVTFVAVLGGFAFMTIVYLRGMEMSRYGMLSLISMLCFISFSVANIEDSDLKNGLYMIIEILMFQMMCYYFRERIHIIVIAAAVFFSFCVYANFLHLMMNPNLWIVEEEKTSLGYLLGYNYNGMGYRFILAVTLSVLCLRYSWKWIFNAVPVIALSVIPLVLTGSKTSLAGILLFVVVCCIPYIRVQKFIINSVLTFVALFQTLVVFSGKGLENNELAVYIIEDVLEKDITFTYRTYLWDMSLEKIAESPIWGFGYLSHEWYASHIHTSAGTGPCNLVLSLMLNGGIIFLVLFFIIFVWSIRNVYRYNDRSAIVLFMGLSTIMLMHLMEALSYVFVFYLMTLCYYYPFIRKERIYTNSENESLVKKSDLIENKKIE